MSLIWIFSRGKEGVASYMVMVGNVGLQYGFPYYYGKYNDFYSINFKS